MTNDDRYVGRKIAEQVAPLLGEGWTFDEANQGYGGIIRGPNGAELFIRIERRRANITGYYPERPSTYGTKFHSITVSIDRSPEGIAADITRRLLPRYLPDLEWANAEAVKAKAAEEARQRLASELAACQGAHAGWRRPDDGELSLHYGEAYGHVKVSYGGEHVSIELNYLTPAQARSVLRALAPEVVCDECGVPLSEPTTDDECNNNHAPLPSSRG